MRLPMSPPMPAPMRAPATCPPTPPPNCEPIAAPPSAPINVPVFSFGPGPSPSGLPAQPDNARPTAATTANLDADNVGPPKKPWKWKPAQRLADHFIGTAGLGQNSGEVAKNNTPLSHAAGNTSSARSPPSGAVPSVSPPP